MEECDILGVKTYSDPSYIFSGVKIPPTLQDLCPRSDGLFMIIKMYVLCVVEKPG